MILVHIADECMKETNSQYFPRSRTLLLTKQNGVLSYIFREFSEVTSYLTLPNCKTQSKGWYSRSRCQTPSQSRFALINRHFFMQAGRERQDGTPGKIVSCVICDVTTRCQALGVFSENYRERVILSTWNVNISESEAIFPLKFRHCSASVPHYKMK